MTSPSAYQGYNTLTGLVQILYVPRDKVAREQIGLITSATRDVAEDRAAVGQIVRSAVTQAVAPQPIVPGIIPADDGAQTILYKDLVISNSYYSPVKWSGEEQRAVGDQFVQIAQKQFEQAFRGLGNLIEQTGVSTLDAGCSRAVGTAGTTPFATTSGVGDMTPFGATNYVLDVNGAGDADRQLVFGNKVMQNIRNMPNIYKANEFGSDAMLKTGKLIQLEGYDFHKSGQIDRHAHVAGTGTLYVSDGTGAVTPSTYQVGETAIKVKTGSGTVVAGDVVTFAGDTNQYVVATGISAPGVLTINAPGLQQTLADGVAMTITGNHVANFAFEPSALILAARMPIMPAGGDAATDSAMVFDPVSGITYEVVEYRVYRQVKYEIAAAWGWLANKPEFAVKLLG